ncbi:hypothetical protein [Winogradskya humida]|uniref:NUDIX domain-containing protein n=1 Tax=Winogradskya humida TaxID=113566 RepID=A0ABQ3ZQU8_9ACTN|nr:hypothetical protein [Actinoplanes humidus]GIE20557.1 hypothetical protein Ahu01nite_036590 [Actinoplanes humidus]
MKAEDVHFLILYRTPERWRTTVAGPGGMACGGLDGTPPDAPFEEAEREFREILAEVWGVEREIAWAETRPGWWNADLKG